MKAARLYEDPYRLETEEIESPVPSRGEALVQIEATGLCGTDLKFIRGFLKPGRYPHTLGHEIFGRVVEALPSDSSEEETIERLKERNVLVYFYVTCHKCEYCVTD